MQHASIKELTEKEEKDKTMGYESNKIIYVRDKRYKQMIKEKNEMIKINKKIIIIKNIKIK